MSCPSARSVPRRPQLEVPAAVNDLYRDMRDRRLLLPALALIVAAFAVPMFLKSDPAPPPPAAESTAVGEPTAAEAAVLVEQTGIRDYRKRLAELKERNPFESNFKTPAPEGGDEVSEDGGSPGGLPPNNDLGNLESDPASTGGGSASVSGGSTTTTDSTSTTVTDGDETVTVDETTTETETETETEVRFYADRADVSIGPLGHGKTIEGVRPLDLLPDKQNPAAAFVGAAPRGEGAVFSLSPDVIDHSGQGSCAPHKPSPCEFLTLKPGQEHFLKYGFKGTQTYRLKLIDSYVVRVPDPRGD